jgi:3-carboxy-cis,cis-muconate cycloisomerase
MSVRLLASLVTTDPLADVFSDRSLLAAMLQFETALARVEARAGIIPADAADTIATAAQPAAFDAAAIARDARRSATIAIPFVATLRARVAEANPAAATFVHWGATSQDLVDTALVLCLARAAAILQQDHARLTESLRELSDKHARTVMVGRTLLQPATPITFGLKAAGWYAGVSRAGAQLFSGFESARTLQFGGAAGTLAALGGDHGPGVAAELARELGVQDPGAPWHAQRDRLASLVAACGVYCGALGKIARDIALLMQFEISEAAERGGGSSAMPHKRNPAASTAALAAANHVPALVAAFFGGMMQEHERGIGGWQAEAWTIAATVQATGAALDSVVEAVGGLSVDPERMRANIAATRGVIFTERAMTLLAPVLGRETARRLIDDAVNAARAGERTFAQALSANADVERALAPADVATLDSPDAYLGAAEAFRRTLLADQNR